MAPILLSPVACRKRVILELPLVYLDGEYILPVDLHGILPKLGRFLLFKWMTSYSVST